MKIVFGTPKDIQPHNFGKNTFVSQPYFKILFEDGLGFYILNSYSFWWVPRFYGMFRKSFWEFGMNWMGWTLEVMWNKQFKSQ